MSQLCIECGELVRSRQQGLQCEPCGGWIHRVCGTGVSQETYMDAVRNELSINWLCASCRNEDNHPEGEQLTLATAHAINSSISLMPDASSTPIHSLQSSISTALQPSSHTIGTLNNTESMLNSSGNSFKMGIIHTSIYSQEESLNDDATLIMIIG